jgi:Ser/Thr protein kinase RdoA (MazF antagonist)
MLNAAGEVVSSRFGIEFESIEPIGQGQAQNAVYRVTTADGTKYAAKHYGSYYRDRLPWVEFEVRFVDHLVARHLPAATVIRTTDNGPFALVDRRPFLMFAWAEGGVEWPASAENAHRLGAALAELHLASDDLPLTGEERHYDAERLIDLPLELLRPFLADRPDLVERLEQWAARLHAAVAQVSTDSPAYGPIHGDIHQGNCYFTESGLTLFDFALSGVGHRVYDLTGFLWPMRDRTINDEGMRVCCDAFLAGYDATRPLSVAEKAAIHTFVQLRTWWELGDWIDAGTGRQQSEHIIGGVEGLLSQLDAANLLPTE